MAMMLVANIGLLLNLLKGPLVYPKKTSAVVIVIQTFGPHTHKPQETLCVDV